MLANCWQIRGRTPIGRVANTQTAQSLPFSIQGAPVPVIILMLTWATVFPNVNIRAPPQTYQDVRVFPPRQPSGMWQNTTVFPKRNSAGRNQKTRKDVGNYGKLSTTSTETEVPGTPRVSPPHAPCRNVQGTGKHTLPKVLYARRQKPNQTDRDAPRPG